MRLSKPSPAMVVSIVALIMASTGTAVAAVSYATNAGSVDRMSAVPSRVSTSAAAGKLVGTQTRGANKGRIASKFLSGVPFSDKFGNYLSVSDNAAGAPNDLDFNEVGKLTAACNDQSGTAGREDPSVVVTYVNSTGVMVNFARTVGGNNAVMSGIAPGTQASFTINGSNTFQVHLEAFGTNVLYNGMVRQDGAGTGDAKCLVVGTSETIK